MRILIIDNYDSFVYNIVGLLREIRHGGAIPVLEWDVRLNDDVDLQEIPLYDAVILSPGPGLPCEAGKMPEVLERFAESIPMFGICLGFQAIAERFGGRLTQLPSPRHGHKSHLRNIDRSDPVTGPLADSCPAVGRYHSWIVDPASLPASLVATSYDEEGNIMSLRHVKHPLFGTQFHPESIISTHGRTILVAFLQYAISTERR